MALLKPNPGYTGKGNFMNQHGKRFWLVFVNLSGFLATVGVNALAVILPINNKSTGQLSDQYPNLFVPAGLTFSIWGAIYLLLAIYCVYELVPRVWRNPERGAFIECVGPLFIFTSIMNISWIFAWHYELMPLSVAIMLLFLLILIAIYLRLKIGMYEALAQEKYLVHMPFSIYLGWISVATIANITALLVYRKWNGLGLSPQLWTVVVMAVAIALAIVMLTRRRDVFYALVIDWALLGILLKRLADSSQADQYVVIAAIVGLVMVTSGVLIRLVTRKVY
jgi:hypothetical protein